MSLFKEYQSKQGDKMKVIFLDIDGVLNTAFSDNGSMLYKKHKPSEEYKNFSSYLAEHFNKTAIWSLNEIVKKTQAKIVISSVWRCETRDDLSIGKSWFPDKDTTIRDAIIGVTPQSFKIEDKYSIRGEEIQVWLDQHREVEKYAIIDDDSDMLLDQMSSFFKTEPYIGLTYQISLEIIKHLNNK